MICVGDRDVARWAALHGCNVCSTKWFCYFCRNKSKYKFHILKPKLSVYQLSIIKVLYLYIKITHALIFSFYITFHS